MITQTQLTLPALGRGFHIVTDDIVKALPNLPDQGILHLFMKHTSAGLCINENADPTVLEDFETLFNHLVPENFPNLKHTIEGPDDMPAHVKSVLCGDSVSIPITDGRLNLGTWQGIYYCEFRNQRHSRKIIATIYS
ncbi:secondary thiamine-phosphate synthase enzyme YjbQ [Membranicola marinus]|uniref:Secondary thiamine-phosphate synthase enzyme YjbQ n=1 Tax=Membranihabitans marinus TaxID=1227546 RepID=A0A953HY25_9BACT|nr:secondary thiamine-phosphate synthase enzyme YjbQ [Membranihabitans marinus]MBY5957827.1 secondary thiamine-phosphate synthase enzyme YjbQ [Membranihabitans marinus]